MTKFSNKLKNPVFFAHFGSIFLILTAKKIFTENPTLSCTTLHGMLAPCQNLEKINDTIPRKHPDGWKDRQRNEQSLFYRTLPGTAGGTKTHTH